MANSGKAMLSKCQAVLLPPIYKASSDATPEIREAAIACLAELVRKQSSAAFLEKVGVSATKQVNQAVQENMLSLVCPSRVCELALCQVCEKLDESRRKKLEELVAAKPSGTASSASQPATKPQNAADVNSRKVIGSSCSPLQLLRPCTSLAGYFHTYGTVACFG